MSLNEDLITSEVNNTLSEPISDDKIQKISKFCYSIQNKQKKIIKEPKFDEDGDLILDNEDEEIIEIDADSLEIALLQASCNPIDSNKANLQSISPMSETTVSIGRKTSIPVETVDNSKSISEHTVGRPSLVRQAKSKHCESPDLSSPDLSSNPSSGSIPKRQRTYSPSSSSDSSR